MSSKKCPVMGLLTYKQEQGQKKKLDQLFLRLGALKSISLSCKYGILWVGVGISRCYPWKSKWCYHTDSYCSFYPVKTAPTCEQVSASPAMHAIAVCYKNSSITANKDPWLERGFISRISVLHLTHNQNAFFNILLPSHFLYPSTSVVLVAQDTLIHMKKFYPKSIIAPKSINKVLI